MGKSLDIIKAPKQKPITPQNVGSKDREKDKGQFFDTPRHEENSDPLLFYLILGLCAIILLVALSVWLIYKSFTGDGNSTSTETTSVTADTNAGVTDASGSDTTTGAAVETTTSTTSSTSSEVDKASVKVRIVNGNGRSGEASLMKQALEDDGFKDITTGNALSQYSTTVIYYNTGKLAEAKAVEAVVSSKYETSLLESPSVAKDNDVLVALGAK